MSLPRESTVVSVAHLLEKLEEYVAGVYGKINAAQRIDPAAAVRIGITGDGKFPNYRIEHSGGLDGPFSRVTHKQIAPTSERDDGWSQVLTSFDEVKGLLAKARK